MNDKIKTVTTVHSVGMKGAGVAGPFCEPSRPASSLDDLMEYFFTRDTALEALPWRGPKQSHLSSSLKDKSHG